MKSYTLLSLIFMLAAVLPAAEVSTNAPTNRPPASGSHEVSATRDWSWLVDGLFGITSAVLGAYATYLFEQRKKMRAERAENEMKQTEASAATKELMEKAKAAKTPSEQDWAQFFVQELAQTDAIAHEISLGSKIAVVASGKGGVGKSTISLALMEYYSRSGKVLLVDFDMPNRGLTSLLRSTVRNTPTTYTLDEMIRFSRLFEKSGLNPAIPGKIDGPGRFLDEFHRLRDAFVTRTEHDGKFTQDLPLFQFTGEPIAVRDETQPVIPTNAYFLPSVKPGDLFLSSSIFGAGFLEVFYFLKCLAYWAKQVHGIPQIIIDCHGAHDLFMVGAIHASTDLVVTMTPDPGSFDGTFDLVAFAEKLKAKLPSYSFPSVLVLNNCRQWQQTSSEAIERFFQTESPVKPTAVVGIPASNSVREISSQYRIGSASASDLWNATKAITKAFGSPKAPTQRTAIISKAQNVEQPQPVRHKALYQLSADEIAVLRAFTNPRFKKSRSSDGIAADAGLSTERSNVALHKLEKAGIVEKRGYDNQKMMWWSASPSAAAYISSSKDVNTSEYSDLE